MGSEIEILFTDRNGIRNDCAHSLLSAVFCSRAWRRSSNRARNAEPARRFPREEDEPIEL